MVSRTEQLTPELERFIERALAEGRYSSRDDLMCDAVRLLHERFERLKELRESVQEAREQIARGEGIHLNSDEDLDRYFDELLDETESDGT
jgi:putative addiction module CopG family antidote